MAATLPTNIHAEVALDQGRLSRNGSERSAERNIAHVRANGMDPHTRVQSLHGVIIETGYFTPSLNHGVIEEEPQSGTLSGADLAAALDQEEGDGEDYFSSTHHNQQWHEQRRPNFSENAYAPKNQQQRSFSPRQASRNNPGSQQQPNGGAYPRSILQNHSGTLSPPPRSASASAPSSAPAQQQFPGQPRFVLSDSGPVSAPPSPGGAHSEQGHGGHPAMRRSVSDSHPHLHSAPNSPGLSVTPPMRRGGSQTSPSTPRYPTFEAMGIQTKNAESEKDCVIM